MAKLLDLKKYNGWRSIKVKFSYARTAEEDNDDDKFKLKVFWDKDGRLIKMPYSKRKRRGWYTFSIGKLWAGEEFVFKLYKNGDEEDSKTIIL